MSSYVVTGGRGIGLELITQLTVPAGNTVFALVRNLKAVPKLQALVAERKNVHVFEADITDLQALKKAAKGVAEITNSIDVLINNAAWVAYSADSFKAPYEFEGNEQSLVDDLNTGFTTNVIGVIHTINAFLPLLRAGKTKKVITISSAMGDPDFVYGANQPQALPYGVSKAGVNMVNAKYAAGLKGEGFIFLAISPGLVDTADTSSFGEEHWAGFAKMAAGFKSKYPDFTGTPISPTESVSKMLAVFDRLEPGDNGSFISHHGNKEWL